MSDTRPAKRTRSAIACHRCKHRKQKCDNGHPACASCVSAGEGETCSYENNVYPEEHVETLRARINELEEQVRTRNLQAQVRFPPLALDVPIGAAGHGGTTQSQTRHVGPASNEGRCHENPGPVVDDESLDDERHPADEHDTGFQMLSPDPSYLGMSSGFSLAKSVQAAIARASSQAHAQQQTWPVARGLAQSTRPRQMSTPSARANSSSEQTRLHFLQVYLTKVHSKHMFLSSHRITALHESYQTLAQPTEPVEKKAILARCDAFILHMVYAIGARYLQLSQDQFLPYAAKHYAAAVNDVECLFETRELGSVDGLLLLAIYQLRSPSQTELWSAISTAMGRAVSLGLHRKSHNASLVTDQRRKRIFWTIYMLDRTLARTLGRPFCISDRDIDVGLPANVRPDVCLDDEEAMSTALQQDSGPTPMSAAIHIVRLARIESKIYHTLHRVDRALSIIELTSDKVARLRQLLDEWRDQIPNFVPHDQDDNDAPNYYVKHSYHILQYHKAFLLLLLPSLSRLSASQADFHLCISSAGQVGQLYKRLHDSQKSLSYSLVALHATFVAGLTLIYCFLADRTIFNLQFSSDLRACSTVLYVISERWTAARKVRDAFEHMISHTVEKADFHNVPMPVSQYTRDGSSGSGGSQQDAEVLWSELLGLMPAQCSFGVVGSAQQDFGRCDPDDLWNSLGSWFGDAEDFWDHHGDVAVSGR